MLDAKRPEIDPELLQYAKDTVDRRMSQFLIPDSSSTVMSNESVTTIVLHRKGAFQTELIIMHPGAPKWPGEHRHPDVDTVEIEVVRFDWVSRNGEKLARPDFVYNGRYLVHLGPDDYHAVQAKPHGAALLSCQKWLNGVAPTSVGLNWEGAAVHPSHAQQQEKMKGVVYGRH
jgi:hypothetical protein